MDAALPAAVTAFSRHVYVGGSIAAINSVGFSRRSMTAWLAQRQASAPCTSLCLGVWLVMTQPRYRTAAGRTPCQAAQSGRVETRAPHPS